MNKLSRKDLLGAPLMLGLMAVGIGSMLYFAFRKPTV
jgi:hypothetical protein